MKKLKVLLLIVLTIIIAGCAKKEAIDEEDFIRIMKDNGFNVVSVEQQFEQYGYFDEAYVAINENKIIK